MRVVFFRENLRSFTAVLILMLAAAAVCSQVAAQNPQNASPLPSPTGFVNDYAGVIDEATKQSLETRLRNFKNSTNPSVEIAVAVVRTTGDRPIFEYSLDVARGWGIGSKADDNPSALLFVAIDDRKYFTQVSKDLEDELPDGLVGSLQRQYLVPEFRKGNYGKGISDTIDAYIRQIQSKGNGTSETAGTNSGEDVPRLGDERQSISGTVCCLIAGIVLLILIFAGRGGGGGRRGRGGWGGGGFGGALPWIIGSAIANSGSSSGSSWGGSGGWSGGGGGFGGFGGGGDFGGGGAGGGW